MALLSAAVRMMVGTYESARAETAHDKDNVILFMTADAMKLFQASRGWEAGVDRNVALSNQ